MRIEDSKIVYNEFKYFKGIYTTINKGESIILYSEDNHIKMIFKGCSQSEFFYFIGELKSDTEFLKWIQSGKKIEVSLEDINKISKCLKSKAKAIEYNNDHFDFIMEEEIISIKNDESIKINENIDFVKSLLIHKIDIPEMYLSSEIFKLYIDKNNQITNNINENRLLEIPTKRILSLQKNSPADCLFSDYIGDKQYVAIESENDSLKLMQIFATI